MICNEMFSLETTLGEQYNLGSAIVIDYLYLIVQDIQR